MNHQLEKIETRLLAFEEARLHGGAQAEKKAQKKPSNAEHIFYDLLTFLAADDKQKEIRLLYQFHTYQECLSLARASSFTLSAAKIDFIERNIPAESEELTRLGMEGIYFPAKAFYLHKVKRHEEAVRLLERSVRRFDTLAEAGLTVAAEAAIEQQLNICRVYLETGRKDEAALAIRHLCRRLDRDLLQKQAMHIEDEDAVPYYVNSLLRACLGGAMENVVEFFSEIIRCFVSMEIFSDGGIPAYFRLLEPWMNNQKEKFIFILCKEIETFFESPLMIQQLVLALLIVVTSESGYPEKMRLCETAARYSRSFIGIEPEKFRKILGALIRQSKVAV